MADGPNLCKLLKEVSGIKVYYQPPETVKMVYPCIRCSRSNIRQNYANDKTYSKFNRYELIVISEEFDYDVVDTLLELEMCSFDRQYVADNLYHYVLSIYY